MKEELNDYNWENVFGYASPSKCVDDGVNTESFDREDVKEIIGLENGENDGDSWVGLFELFDGRFACLRASCDYTGWG